MEIIDFVLQNWVWVALAVVVLGILILAIRTNFAFDNYLQKLEQFLQEKTAFSGNIWDFCQQISWGFFAGQVAATTLADDNHGHGCYVPSQRSVKLAPKIAGAANVASIAVAAHEFGHARQHFENPEILQKNFQLSKCVKFLGGMNWLILLFGILGTIWLGAACAIVALVLFALNFFVAISLKYSTLRMEKDASKNALDMLKQSGMFAETDLAKIKKFLLVAKKTYTADFWASVLAWTMLVRRTKIF